MKNLFGKLVTMSLAAVMAVSAMSIGAMAKEDTSNDVVMSVLNEDGVMQDYTQAEIDALGGSVIGYEGMVVTPMSDEEIAEELKASALRPTMFSVMEDPVGYDNSYTPIYSYSMANYAYYNGYFTVGKNKSKYSNCYLKDLSSRVNVLIEPEVDDDGHLINEFGGKFKALVYNYQTGANLMSLNVNAAAGATITRLTSTTNIYVELYNGNNFTANGYATLRTY